VKTPSDLGFNRTGIGTSPVDARALVQGAREGARSPGDDALISDFRQRCDAEATRVGSMPPPLKLRAVVRMAGKVLKGQKPAALLDMLGERLAFERTAARLYEALMTKYDAAGYPRQHGPTAAELERIYLDELRHFKLLRDGIVDLGADPTVLTPCADSTLVAIQGILQVLADPRTSIPQCLNAMLMLELADTDGWTLLVELADGFGYRELARELRKAHSDEADHLRHLRRWLVAAVRREARVGARPAAEEVEVVPGVTDEPGAPAEPEPR
jgi:hypothetical protein